MRALKIGRVVEVRGVLKDVVFQDKAEVKLETHRHGGHFKDENHSNEGQNVPV